MSCLAGYPILGKGYFATVYKACINGNPVAMKVLKNKAFGRCMIEKINNEIEVMSNLRHKNIVEYMFANSVELGGGNYQVRIFMQYCHGIDLRRMIDRRKDMNLLCTNGQIMAWFQGTARGIQFLHDNDVIHRDIKPDNIMLHHGSIKIADFGHATLIEYDEDYLTDTRGAPIYACPEMYFKNQCHRNGDIWSLGVTFYELTTLKRPFKRIADLRKYEVGSYHVKPISSSYPDEVINLIFDMLEFEPNYRPTIDDVVSRLR